MSLTRSGGGSGRRSGRLGLNGPMIFGAGISGIQRLASYPEREEEEWKAVQAQADQEMKEQMVEDLALEEQIRRENKDLLGLGEYTEPMKKEKREDIRESMY